MKKVNVEKKMKRTRILFALVVLFILVTIFARNSLSEYLENDVEVKPRSQLTYYLNVTYDGVDKNGVESNDTRVSKITSGTLFVEDKIPDGLEFIGFVTTDDGSIGAVKRSDGTICSGKVIDDTHEESNTTGAWNAGNTEYTYHGLHYDATTRTVTFKVKNIQAGCELNVGIITQTPTIDDPDTPEVEKRRDFYNFATARERTLTSKSNTVHVFMGKENVTMQNVTYQYTGTVPTNAPALPETSSYAPGAKVGTAADSKMEGYTFSGWTTTDATVTDGSFIMPSTDVVLTGSFTSNPNYKVTYSITGTVPDGYVLPTEKYYYPETVVDLDTLDQGDIINHYRFKGWSSNNVVITEDRDFEMPSQDITITGEFEEEKYRVSYQFYDGILPPDSDDYLPESQEFRPGESVTLEDVTDEPTGYRFLGWYKEDEFEMPEENVVIFGEWKAAAGYFTPTITIAVDSTTTYFRPGDQVPFNITITNTAGYPIHDVMIKEDLDAAVYANNGANIEVLSDHIVKIDSIASGASVVVHSYYTVLSTDSGTITNPVELIGALADNNFELAEGTYTASTNFKIQSSLTICKLVNGSYNENTFQIHVTSTNYDTWMNLEKDECKTLYLDPASYTIKEILPQEYNLVSVLGSINTNGGQLTVEENKTYTITFTNTFVRKRFLHSFGRVVNQVGS